jgi:hypothetical protein
VAVDTLVVRFQQLMIRSFAEGPVILVLIELVPPKDQRWSICNEKVHRLER